MKYQDLASLVTNGVFFKKDETSKRPSKKPNKTERKFTIGKKERTTQTKKKRDNFSG